MYNIIDTYSWHHHKNLPRKHHDYAFCSLDNEKRERDYYRGEIHTLAKNTTTNQVMSYHSKRIYYG